MADRLNRIKRQPFRFGSYWQACDRSGPFAPMRMFQFQALNDLPDHALAGFDEEGYLLNGGYRVVSRDRPEDRCHG